MTDEVLLAMVKLAMKGDLRAVKALRREGYSVRLTTWKD